MKRTFAVVLIPDDTGYRVRMPALPEVNSQGKDRAEVLEQRAADGDAVPEQDAGLDTVTVEAAA